VVNDEMWLYYTGANTPNITQGTMYEIGLARSKADGHVSLAWQELLTETTGSASGSTDYSPSGTLTSAWIAPPEGNVWQRFYASYSQPAGTQIAYAILDASGATLLPSVPSGTDLSALGATPIRLQAELTTSTPSLTPVLQGWCVSWQDKPTPVNPNENWGRPG
jgi:hypothetical protein